ncbi:phosphopyruvate hydratase [Candidatus Micrarchaeota archaeon]|nr:phosphopyruvate hydratase [Candidatus Micrarchaeota archaeon]MBU1165330.1 phosphopyruvate hydratase [Candidatus Micrarchaeota archaeon]MBU1886980.1 phosphopyruvate hydratase [Candidatus Micrarchaeota archaeon]
MKIEAVWAREILDSRGNPTIEVDVVTENAFASAAAPSGASTGKHEAVELRDGGDRYMGKGVLRAVGSVNGVIAPAIIGMDVHKQKEIDNAMIELDGTSNKSSLGANATVATSMAVLRAAAASDGKMLHNYLGGSRIPHAMFNIVNGGLHAGNKLAIQEFMIVPESDLFSHRLQMASEIYHTLGKQLVRKLGKSARNVGDEGGYAPQLDNTYKVLDEIAAAVEEAGYGGHCSFAMDAAASSFYDENTKKYNIDEKELSESELTDYYVDLVKSYPVKSIEDPFHEESFTAFAGLRKDLPQLQVVGDDLVVTNVNRLKRAINEKSINTLLLKVNQIGTVSEAMDAVHMCRNNAMNVVVSHRSGETEDCFIADFCVGIDAGQIKTGAPARGERTSKYNQLLRIEERLLAEVKS